MDFSKAGKVTIYAEYPKSMGLKGRKLGEWPEMLDRYSCQFPPEHGQVDVTKWRGECDVAEWTNGGVAIDTGIAGGGRREVG
ncbi:hypothetical protein [Xenorhabdus littoralis]|uniref:hypothetical protein n=1 Tax=Xenorhabdus littoralis TaxID=2582835 RepID=UPI003AFFF87D